MDPAKDYRHRIFEVARLMRGHTQCELAKLAGCSPSRISRLERGWHDTLETTPVAELRAICEVLKLEPEAIMQPKYQLAAQRRWRARIAMHFLYTSRWDTLTEVLALSASEMCLYQPSVIAIGQIVRNHQQVKHRLYYGERSATDRPGQGARKQIDLPETKPVRQFLDAVAMQDEAKIHVFGGRNKAPEWCPAPMTKVWMVTQKSEHGVMLLYCATDPDYLGNISNLTSSCADIIDRALDVIYRLDEVGGSRMSELEQRVRQIEATLRRGLPPK